MRPALVLLLAIAPLTVQAQLYKWVDENGRTHYSEKPPPKGQKSQTVRTEPAPSPTVTAPEPAAKKAKAAAKAPQGAADGERLEGNWTTAAGAAVDVRFNIVSRGGSSLMVAQQWTIGSRSQIKTPSDYELQGAGGAGTLVMTSSPSPHTPDIPMRAGYRLEGDVLRLSVPSGQYAGEHVLRKRAN